MTGYGWTCPHCGTPKGEGKQTGVYWNKRAVCSECAPIIQAARKPVDVGRRCEAHDGARRCSREDGHDGLHDCGYSFAGIVEDIHAKKLTGTVHFLHGRPKLADMNGQRAQIDVNGCLMQD